MSIDQIVNVQISLQTTTVTQKGFGVGMFMGAHRWFPERIKTYVSLTDAATDIPVGSDEYKALEGFFANTPSPQEAKIGRIIVDSQQFTPDTPSATVVV